MEKLYYAKVEFGADLLEKQMERDLLRALNGVQIIEVKKEDIDRWYEEECTKNPLLPSTDRFVLHGEEQKERFGYIMKTFFSGKDYVILEKPDDEGFQKWLDSRKEHRS